MSFEIVRDEKNTYFFDEEKRQKRDWRRPLRSIASDNLTRQDRDILLVSLFSDVVITLEKEKNEDVIKNLKRVAVILLDTVIPYKKEIRETYPNIKKELTRMLETLKGFTVDLEERNGDIATSKGFF